MSLLFCAAVASGAVYNGNKVAMDPSQTDYIYFDGAVGLGKLTLNDNAGAISATFNRGGPDPFQYSLVFFIDSVSGGISTTASLTPSSTYGERSVSGLSGASRSVMNFASGFTADYAIVLNVSLPNASGLYRIDSATSFHKVRDITPNPATDVYATAISFNWNWSEISAGGPTVNSFKFQSTYIDTSAYRSLEGFETLSGSVGFGTVNAAGYNVYNSAVPEPVNIALSIFGGCFGIAGLAQVARRRAFAR